ncbi:hypothetical protein MCEMSE15_01044 [Fimbriimonadaceae bacterium]
MESRSRLLAVLPGVFLVGCSFWAVKMSATPGIPVVHRLTASARKFAGTPLPIQPADHVELRIWLDAKPRMIGPLTDADGSQPVELYLESGHLVGNEAKAGTWSVSCLAPRTVGDSREVKLKIDGVERKFTLTRDDGKNRTTWTNRFFPITSETKLESAFYTTDRIEKRVGKDATKVPDWADHGLLFMGSKSMIGVWSSSVLERSNRGAAGNIEAKSSSADRRQG